MVFLRRSIIHLCGVEFGGEAAEPEAFAVNPDFGGVSACAFFEIDADILGGGFGTDFLSVTAVFRVCGEAEVGPTVIEPIVISMVNDETFGEVHKLPVHTDHFGFAGADFDIPEGVEFLTVAVEVPIEIFKPIVIHRRDNRPFPFA
jgi:hypothetical protein